MTAALGRKGGDVLILLLCAGVFLNYIVAWFGALWWIRGVPRIEEIVLD